MNAIPLRRERLTGSVRFRIGWFGRPVAMVEVQVERADPFHVISSPPPLYIIDMREQWESEERKRIEAAWTPCGTRWRRMTQDDLVELSPAGVFSAQSRTLDPRLDAQ